MDEIQKIVSLLESTDMPISDIAAKLGCTRVSVHKINEKYSVRNYQTFTITQQQEAKM